MTGLTQYGMSSVPTALGYITILKSIIQAVFYVTSRTAEA